MRTTLTLALVFCVTGAIHAQDLAVAALRGRRANQGSTGSPVQRTDATAFFFQAEVSGASPFEPIRNLALRLPDNSSRPLQKLASGNYAVRADFSTEAAAHAAFPNGRYQFEATFNLIGAVTAHAVLPPPNFPSFPEVLDQSRSLPVDVNSDYTLSWQPFAQTESGDRLQLRITDASTQQTLTEETDLDPASTEWVLSAGTLGGDKTYNIQLAYARLAETSQLDSGELIPGVSYWVSETSFSIRTSAGTDPADSTPPSLITVSPGDGTLLAHATDGVFFQFSEPMDVSRTRISWKATQNGQPAELSASNFTLFWAPDGRSLFVTYNPLAGGWPAGLSVRWEINAQPGTEGNLRDLAGNELPARSGAFITAGGPDPCAAQASTSNSGSAFAFFKVVNYQQANAGTPAADPGRGAQAFAFLSLPSSVPVQTIVTLKVPTDNPFAFKLKVLSPPSGATGLGFRVLQEQFPARSDLDDAYPDGTYQFELRNNAAQTTNSVPLSVNANGYPPIPHVANFAACQAVRSTDPFTPAWDPFTGATTNRESVTLDIYDAAGNLVFHAPNPCTQITLDPAAGGITIPAGTFAAGTNYNAELTFSRLTDSGKSLPSIPGYGVAALTRITRFPLVTLANVTPTNPPQFTRLVLADEHNLQIELKCSAGRLLTLESVPALGAPWVTLITTNPPGNQLTLTVPKQGPSGFLRASQP